MHVVVGDSFCNSSNHFYNFEWIYIVFLGTVFAGIVIPSFRRIRRPRHSLRTDFNTRRNCSYRRCSRNHGKCRNHAARCFDFYFKNSVVQKYHSFYGQKIRLTKMNVSGKKIPFISVSKIPPNSMARLYDRTAVVMLCLCAAVAVRMW